MDTAGVTELTVAGPRRLRTELPVHPSKSIYRDYTTNQALVNILFTHLSHIKNISNEKNAFEPAIYFILSINVDLSRHNKYFLCVKV